MNLFSFSLQAGGEERICLSVVQPSDPEFTPKSILGFLKDNNGDVVPGNIIYNPEFVDLFHKSIVLYALNSAKHIETASVQEKGFIYITDLRTPEGDIIGSFEILNGRLQPMSYQPKPGYLLISDKGMFCLPPEAEKYLMLAVTMKD